MYFITKIRSIYFKTFIHYKNIQIYTQSKNIGAVENFKFLARKANSDFFMWAASDDRWHPEYISKLVKVLINSEAILSFSGISYFDENHNFISSRNLSGIAFIISMTEEIAVLKENLLEKSSLTFLMV